jgi:hypothetical protein
LIPTLPIQAKIGSLIPMPMLSKSLLGKMDSFVILESAINSTSIEKKSYGISYF